MKKRENPKIPIPKGKKLKTAGQIVSGSASIIKGVGSILEAVGGNHPQWYEAYPLTNLVSLNFGQREKLGKTIRCNGHALYSPADARIPIKLVLPTSPGKDAFREAHQIIMNKLRAATGSNVTYTIDDLLLYSLNAREIIALYSVIRRTILCTRITDLYDEDAHYKYALISNSGKGGSTITISTLIQNLATDTVRLNRLSSVISSLIPIKMSILARTSWLFSNIFADSKTAKFSTKMFTLNESGFWTKDSSGNVVRTEVTVGNTTLGFQLDTLESLISQFSAQVQNSRIAGDYLKAFGSFFVHLQPIEEGTRIVPLYDEAALTQIQNATIMPGDITSKINNAGRVENKASIATNQDLTNTALFSSAGGGAYVVLAPATARATSSLVNTYKDHVSPGELLSLTRLVTLCSFDTGDVNITTTGGKSTVEQAITVNGTEIVNGYSWATSTVGAASVNLASMAMELMPNTITGLNTIAVPYAPTIADGEFINEFTQMCWAMDDWAPRYIAGIIKNSTPGVAIDEVFALFDYSNWAELDRENLGTYHQLAVMSLFATPDRFREMSDFQFL